jgi:methylated-DNA-[protein]-cysteine S-methyltransferase
MGFRERVYGVVSGIPSGKVMSYSQVAREAGSPGASRAVGTVMARNPFPGAGPGKVPCHRVVKSDRSLGGFSGREGVEGKRFLLEREGVRFSGGLIDKEYFVV